MSMQYVRLAHVLQAPVAVCDSFVLKVHSLSKTTLGASILIQLLRRLGRITLRVRGRDGFEAFSTLQKSRTPIEQPFISSSFKSAAAEPKLRKVV